MPGSRHLHRGASGGTASHGRVASSAQSRLADAALLGAMYAVLIGNFVWHRLAPLPLLVHVLIAAGAIHLSFTIWHEAVHQNVSHRSWLNHG